MQAVKLVIPGRFWDCQLYSNRLYLFGVDGAISTYRWDTIVRSFGVPERLKLALECAFTRSDYFYGSKWKLLFADKEIRDVIKKKFEDLSLIQLEVDQPQLAEARVRTQDNRFPFPHTDCTVYNNHLYCSSQKGIYYNALAGERALPIRRAPDRLWDCPIMSLAASYYSLATAAGADGLFRLSLYDVEGAHRTSEDVEEISDNYFTHCNWLYSNIYGSSHYGRACFADFSVKTPKTLRENDPFNDEQPHKTSTLSLKRSFYSDEIFHESGYSWGAKDKLFLVHGTAIKTVRLKPRTRYQDLAFEAIGETRLSDWKGEVVSGGVALFGAIIECDNAIVVMKSNGESVTLAGEPVRYRVFNRSSYYENQLHVIYDDRLEIFSFNDDYFVEQTTKEFGYTASAS